MVVCVESNFVLEHALQQEQCDSCEQIVKLAASSQISLTVPAFALAEPYQALIAKAKAREKLSKELESYRSELRRSKPYRELPDDLGSFGDVLSN